MRRGGIGKKHVFNPLQQISQGKPNPGGLLADAGALAAGQIRKTVLAGCAGDASIRPPGLHMAGQAAAR